MIIERIFKEPKCEFTTWCEVDLEAVRSNLKILRRLCARNKLTSSVPKEMLRPRNMAILAVIKADAYGHGMKEVGLYLERAGVEFFGVSDVREGVRLRSCGVSKPILLFESTLPDDAWQIMDFNLMPSVCTWELVKRLNAYAEQKKRTINIHINVDTGMGRLGVWHEEAYSFIKKIIRDYRFLTVQGIYTHFPVADTKRAFTQGQIKTLHALVTRLDRSGLVIPYIHAANSMGLAGYETHVLNLARPGLMLYGLHPDKKLKKKIKLKPSLSVKSKVILVQELKKGRGISYGRKFIAKKEMRVATVPVGYSDGYMRLLSNKAFVLIAGRKCPILGTITMDEFMVDVSKVKNVKLGAPVTIIGKDGGKEISADDLAQMAGTINYEIVCSLGSRLPRIYK